jgi:PAS domain S-box-containing protein
MRMATRAAVIYLLIGWLWILLSDQALNAIAGDDHATFIRIQSYKGLFFVLASAALLFAMVYVNARRQWRVQRALLASEARQQSAYQLVSVGLCQVSTVDGRFLRVNRRLCEITGYDEAELLSLRYADITHPDDRERDIEQFSAMVTGRTPRYESETRYVRKDGRIIWAHVNATLVHGADDPQRSVAVVQDITERVQGEARLRQSEARFRELADAMPQMVFITSGTGQVEYVNERWVEYTGTPLAEAMPERFDALVHPDDRDDARAEWLRVLREGGQYSREYRLRRVTDGVYRWQLCRAVPTYDADGRVVRYFGTITDIDDNRRAVEEVHRLNETLEQRVRDRTAQLQAVNDELDAFTYTVSHDLRAPLRSQQTFARQILLTDEARLSDEAKSLLRRTVATSARMDRLITDLLDYSRLSRADLKLVPVSTVTIVHELIGQLQRDPATATANVIVREPLPWVLGNRLLLQMVFANLLDNAVKFVRPGQAPIVRVWAEDVPPATPPAQARIWIEDNGIGVSAEHFKRVFQPFETLNRAGSFEGTGIGLAIVKRTIDRLNGRVGLESTENVGSRFWIELPIADVE